MRFDLTVRPDHDTEPLRLLVELHRPDTSGKIVGMFDLASRVTLALQEDLTAHLRNLVAAVGHVEEVNDGSLWYTIRFQKGRSPFGLACMFDDEIPSLNDARVHEYLSTKIQAARDVVSARLEAAHREERSL